jgi:putative phosphoribosyl transferase
MAHSTVFRDRIDAGQQLAAVLGHLRGPDTVVVGLPRGGVPVAACVAEALEAPLDVILVRKLGVPFQPELAMGAIGEDDVRVVDAHIVRMVGVGAADLAAVEARERAELERRGERYRRGRQRTSLVGRTVVVVDDGVATGSTARAACQVARAEGARRVVLAVPVAPSDWTHRLGDAADEYVAVETPDDFSGVGQFYRDFTQTSDATVVALLDDAARPRLVRDEDIRIPLGAVTLDGHLSVPRGAGGVVVFAHGSGSSRHSPRNQRVASVLVRAGLATLLFDLLTSEEERDRSNVFDIDLLGHRLHDVIRSVVAEPDLTGLPVGCFGASTGAAAALAAAAQPDSPVAAVVSRGGRPDLAGPHLRKVTAPTLLIVGGEDRAVLELNRRALEQMGTIGELVVVPGATHLFEEPGTLDAAAGLARDWFLAHLERAGQR